MKTNLAGSLRKRYPATFSITAMQKSSWGVEYSMSAAGNSAARIWSLSITVPPSSAARARLRVLLPHPGSPAIKTSMCGEYRTEEKQEMRECWKGNLRNSEVNKIAVQIWVWTAKVLV